MELFRWRTSVVLIGRGSTFMVKGLGSQTSSSINSLCDLNKMLSFFWALLSLFWKMQVIVIVTISQSRLWELNDASLSKRFRKKEVLVLTCYPSIPWVFRQIVFECLLCATTGHTKDNNAWHLTSRICQAIWKVRYVKGSPDYCCTGTYTGWFAIWTEGHLCCSWLRECSLCLPK